MPVRFEIFDESKHRHLIDPLTELLHRAYAPLAAKGMRYLATHQPPSKTLERLKEGESYLGFQGAEVVATITLYKEKFESTCDYYRQLGVYSFGQFAVSPTLQRQGCGSALMDLVERRARALGAKELALDTSEHADHLIDLYRRRGYEIVAHTKWEAVNYRSVIMTKIL